MHQHSFIKGINKWQLIYKAYFNDHPAKNESCLNSVICSLLHLETRDVLYCKLLLWNMPLRHSVLPRYTHILLNFCFSFCLSAQQKRWAGVALPISVLFMYDETVVNTKNSKAGVNISTELHKTKWISPLSIHLLNCCAAGQKTDRYSVSLNLICAAHLHLLLAELCPWGLLTGDVTVARDIGKVD